MVERSAPKRRLWRWLLLAVAGTVVGTVAGLSGCATLDHWGTPHDEAAQADARKAESPQWHDGEFHNPQPMWNNTLKALTGVLFNQTPARAPESPVPVLASDGEALASPPATGLRVTWFGHSSTLLEIDGQKVLLDPIWSQRPSPVSWAGPQRWFAPPIALDKLPRIDAVLVSHDHYDHLDAPTIQALNQWAQPPRFIVPLGIGERLRLWGVPAERITELDWWQATALGQLQVTATPARHASGRLNPRSNHTLWAGYAFIGPQHKAWYSGDTGLHDTLREIGQRLGPFDLTLIESGQYDADWPDWHLGPEQAVLANQWVGGKVMMPVHWGLFALANHGWTEPAERVLAAARCNGTQVLTPRPGDSVQPTLADGAGHTPWWPEQPWRGAAEKPVRATQAGDPAQRMPQLDCKPGA